MTKRNCMTLFIVLGLVGIALPLMLLSGPDASLANLDSLGTVTLVDEGFEGTFPPAGWTQTGHWGKSSCQKQAGSYSAWVEGAGGVPCEQSIYHPNESSMLKYGPFSLSDAISATLSFDIWLWSVEGDTFSWGASTNGVDYYGISVTNDFSQGWQKDGLDLSAVPVLGDLSGEPNVWIRFMWETDDFAEGFDGVFIDNVKVIKSISPSETHTPVVPSSTATNTPTKTATPDDSSDESTVYLPPVIKNGGPTSTPTATATVGPPTQTPTPDAENDPPRFPSPLNTNISTELTRNELGQVTGAKTTIKILTPATDPDGDPITYSWAASNGTITGDGLTAVWDRVIYYGGPLPGKVTVTASDGRGGTAKVEFNIN